MERVVLAFSKDETASKIKRILNGTSYEVCSICHSKYELLRYTADLDNVLIIMGYKLGSDLAEDIVLDLPPHHKLMSIVRTENKDMISSDDIFIVTLPVDRQNLLSAIEIFLGVVSKHKSTRRDPSEDLIIQKSKLFLMEEYHMTEQQAHRFIQKRSMNIGAKFIDTAKSILDAQ